MSYTPAIARHARSGERRCIRCSRLRLNGYCRCKKQEGNQEGVERALSTLFDLETGAGPEKG
jgi:hypothetical protein